MLARSAFLEAVGLVTMVFDSAVLADKCRPHKQSIQAISGDGVADVSAENALKDDASEL